MPNVIENGNKRFTYNPQIVNEQGNIETLNTGQTLPLGDWRDSAAYQAQAISQSNQNAYDLSLWKYQQNFLTDLNSPKSQMERFGQAGLNPYLLASNIQGTTPVAAMQSHSPLKAQSNAGRTLQQVVSGTQGMISALSKVFELVESARTQNSVVANQNAQAQLTQQQARSLFLENKAKEYLYFGQNYYYEGEPGPHGNVNIKTFDDGLFAASEKNKVDQQDKQLQIMEERRKYYIEQLEALGVSKELAQQQVNRLESQYGWINSIENPFLRTLCFWIMSNASLPGFSFSGKMF